MVFVIKGMKYDTEKMRKVATVPIYEKMFGELPEA